MGLRRAYALPLLYSREAHLREYFRKGVQRKSMIGPSGADYNTEGVAQHRLDRLRQPYIGNLRRQSSGVSRRPAEIEDKLGYAWRGEQRRVVEAEQTHRGAR